MRWEQAVLQRSEQRGKRTGFEQGFGEVPTWSFGWHGGCWSSARWVTGGALALPHQIKAALLQTPPSASDTGEDQRLRYEKEKTIKDWCHPVMH